MYSKHFIQQQVTTPNTTRIPIILGDWNEECIGTSTSQKLCDLGLVDVWRFRNPTHHHFKTYHRGNRRIGFALTTPHLASLAVNMVYEPFFYRTSGDHRGLYLDFDITSLFTTNVPTFGSFRGFTSKDRKAVKTYLTKFQAHMEAHNVFQRFNTLVHSGVPNHDLIEITDREITTNVGNSNQRSELENSTTWSFTTSYDAN